MLLRFVAIKLSLMQSVNTIRYIVKSSVVAMAMLKVIKHPILFLGGLELETYTF